MEEQKVTTRGIALDIDETLAATNYYWVRMLEERFGNPEHLPHKEIIRRYRYTQHVPFWQTPEALAWMEEARNSDEIQEEILLIEDADHVVERLHKVVPISAYITARPEGVRRGTKRWLARHGFPEAPLIMRPTDLIHEDSTKWKAELLASLYPTVRGIIDDNASLLLHLPENYGGTIFLYDHTEAPKTDIKVVAVKRWDDVLSAVSALLH